ncbi:unnamed protein product [Didymodactylos carnosus]|uniref:Signal peptide peptidase family protein n=1 Tax=Didymodactylos carnosus TaxID=1234261 RepID=A0A8S2GFB7_9BILA|nr:unnamed protein product [Didymodactylos carnosus]CAF3511827.1 unnamed protein product [Didymodactylos carnosus]
MDTGESLNLITSLKSSKNINRYCLQLALLPQILPVKQFGWHNYYYASTTNGCDKANVSALSSLSIADNSMFVIHYNANCSFAEQSYNFQLVFGDKISLLYIIVIPYTIIQSLTTNKTLPVTIPVLLIRQSEFNGLINDNKTNQIEQISIDYSFHQSRLNIVTLLMYILIILVLFAGTMWAGDEFIQKVKESVDYYAFNQQGKYTAVNPNPINNNDSMEPLATNQQSSPNLSTQTNTTQVLSSSPTDTVTVPLPRSIVLPPPPSFQKLKELSSKENEQAILAMPYCTILFLLITAVAWILLIWKFPTVMVKILQTMFCISGLFSLKSCLKRFSYIKYFVKILRRFEIRSCEIRKPCKYQIGPINYFSILTFFIGLTVVILWYVYRKQRWSWILQDIIGAALCIVVLSVYRLANMKVITLILSLFFFYDIFFVFITPYIPFFNDSTKTNLTTLLSTQTTISATGINSTLTSTLSPYYIPTIQREIRNRNPSIMEKVALGLGSGDEVVPLLFSVPRITKYPDPCITSNDQKIGFGDIILPGILITYCKIFDIASNNRIHVYYIQSLIAYSIGYILVIIALVFMNMPQPALLYLVPCTLLSTIFTGLIRRELKELYSGRRIKQIFEQSDQISVVSKHDNQIRPDGDG